MHRIEGGAKRWGAGFRCSEGFVPRSGGVDSESRNLNIGMGKVDYWRYV